MPVEDQLQPSETPVDELSAAGTETPPNCRKRTATTPRTLAPGPKRRSPSTVRTTRKKTTTPRKTPALAQPDANAVRSPQSSTSESEAEFELPISASVHLSIKGPASEVKNRHAMLPKWDISYDDLLDWLDAEMAPLHHPWNSTHYRYTVQGDIVKQPRKTGLNLIDRAESWDHMKRMYTEKAGAGAPFLLQFQYLFESKDKATIRASSATQRQHEALKRSPDLEAAAQVAVSLRKRWTCPHHGFCYQADNDHYRVPHAVLESWTDAIMDETATIDCPPPTVERRIISDRNRQKTAASNTVQAAAPAVIDSTTIEMLVKAQLYDHMKAGLPLGSASVPRDRPKSATSPPRYEASKTRDHSPLSPLPSSDICADESDDQLLIMFAEYISRNSPQTRRDLEDGLSNCAYEGIGFLALRDLLFNNDRVELKELGFKKGAVMLMMKYKTWRPDYSHYDDSQASSSSVSEKPLEASKRC